jgi:hypothetical protein
VSRYRLPFQEFDGFESDEMMFLQQKKLTMMETNPFGMAIGIFEIEQFLNLSHLSDDSFLIVIVVSLVDGQA